MVGKTVERDATTRRICRAEKNDSKAKLDTADGLMLRHQGVSTASGSGNGTKTKLTANVKHHRQRRDVKRTTGGKWPY